MNEIILAIESSKLYLQELSFKITISSSDSFVKDLAVKKTLSPNEATPTVLFFWGNSLKVLKSIRKTKR
ncbi:hypothetical protein [Oceanobacillus massiliensis]|uniref:hypothetical protein n=1 Tax=Oceanobacillus massiliensis TaxID=1465765 RepID=UPI001F37F902|nr:hypothetical protein [Oceanobacillus massiliensis]